VDEVEDCKVPPSPVLLRSPTKIAEVVADPAIRTGKLPAPMAKFRTPAPPRHIPRPVSDENECEGALEVPLFIRIGMLMVQAVVLIWKTTLSVEKSPPAAKFRARVHTLPAR
jgi:hypothetical protein